MARRVFVATHVGVEQVDCEIECTVDLARGSFDPPHSADVEFVEAWVGRERRPALLDLITDADRERIEVKAVDLACDADLAAADGASDSARDDRRFCEAAADRLAASMCGLSMKGGE